MSNALGCLKTAVITVVLTVGTTTTCYAATATNLFGTVLGEQAKGVQFTNTTPEPETMLLLGIGLILLAAVSRIGKNKLNR